MPSPSQTVLSTPELLESILLHLPPSTLLKIHLVSLSFHSTILTSPRLQAALFFRPTPSPSPTKWTINPFLRQHFLPFFVGPERHFSSRDFDTLRRLDWTKDPAKKDAFLREDASWRRMLVVQPASRELRVVRWTHGQGGDGESWADVPFPSTPRSDREGEGGKEEGKDEGGYVTMGKLYDITHTFLHTYYGSYGSFGLSFTSTSPTDSTPKLTLYLRMTMQCMGGYSAKSDLSSRGKDPEWNLYKLQWQRNEERGRRFNMEWETELREEDGGVGELEWAAWKKSRVVEREKSPSW